MAACSKLSMLNFGLHLPLQLHSLPSESPCEEPYIHASAIMPSHLQAILDKLASIKLDDEDPEFNRRLVIVITFFILL
jgi:hypothetical protein